MQRRLILQQLSCENHIAFTPDRIGADAWQRVLAFAPFELPRWSPRNHLLLGLLLLLIRAGGSLHTDMGPTFHLPHITWRGHGSKGFDNPGTSGGERASFDSRHLGHGVAALGRFRYLVVSLDSLNYPTCDNS